MYITISYLYSIIHFLTFKNNLNPDVSCDYFALALIDA